MPAQYQFIDRWFVPAPVGDVYDVIGDQIGYTAWWDKVSPCRVTRGRRGRVVVPRS